MSRIFVAYASLLTHMDAYEDPGYMAHNQTIPTWDLADRLRKIRRDRHMTQEEFARELDVKPVTLSAWEAGRTKPHDVTEIALLIERKYGVPAAWTLGVMPGYDRRREDLPDQRLRRRLTDMITGMNAAIA